MAQQGIGLESVRVGPEVRRALPLGRRLSRGRNISMCLPCRWVLCVCRLWHQPAHNQQEAKSAGKAESYRIPGLRPRRCLRNVQSRLLRAQRSHLAALAVVTHRILTLRHGRQAFILIGSERCPSGWLGSLTLAFADWRSHAGDWLRLVMTCYTPTGWGCCIWSCFLTPAGDEKGGWAVGDGGQMV